MLVAFAFAVGGGAAVPHAAEPDPLPAVATQRPPSAAATRSGADPTVLDCLIQPSDLVDIGSQTVGLIEEVTPEVGDRVSAGELVVRLEAGVEEAAVRAAESRATAEGTLLSQQEQVALQERRAERGATLFESRALSAEEWDEMQSEARIARHDLRRAEEAQELAWFELKQAEAALERRRLRSPIDGLVVARNLSPGEVVDGATILTIAKIDPLHVDVLLPANRFGEIRPGRRAALSPEIGAESRVVATVDRVDPVVDAASGTFKVRLELPNPDGQVAAGLHCSVELLD